MRRAGYVGRHARDWWKWRSKAHKSRPELLILARCGAPDMWVGTPATGGNGARRPMGKVFGPSPGATGLSICLTKRFAPSRCRGASVANGSILFVTVGDESKS